MSQLVNKSDFIAATIQLALYLLVIIFFTFVFLKVNRSLDKAHRCTINLMLVCLQLAAFCKFYFFFFLNYIIVLGTIIWHSADIWAYYRGDSFTDQELNLYVSLAIISQQLRYLFVELAIMLNITIWGNFFLKIKIHRDIQYDEIYAVVMYELEDENKEKKE